MALRDSVEALRAREHLALVACRRGDAVRAASLANVTTGGPLDAPFQRALLAESIGDVLADAGRPDAAARTWRRALRALLAGGGLSYPAAEVVCRIARQQLEHLGPDPAAETVALAVERARERPLSPEPDLRYAWRLLYETGLAEPALAAPIRDFLRVQARVPPGWCYVLGLLELATGHRQRARWAAEALDRGHAANPKDGESGWLAALLWMKCGDARQGLASTQRILGAEEPGRIAVIPGRVGGPVVVEAALGEALLSVGLAVPAVALARSAEDPALRGTLLVEAAETALVEGRAEVARSLAREAAASLAELDSRAGTGWLANASRLVTLLEELQAPDVAARVLDAAVTAAADAPGDMSLTALCEFAHALDQGGSPGASRPRRVLADRVAAASDPSDRCRLLLRWLEASAPAG